MRTVWIIYWTLVGVFAAFESFMFYASFQEAGSVMPICGMLFTGCGIAGLIIFLVLALLLLIFVPKKKDAP